MKNTLFFALLSFLYLYTSAQLSYEKGYFIDNEGKRTEGLIENHDWKNNPIVFYFKSAPQAEIEKKVIHDVQEFGIDTKVKFQRKFIDIDRSSGSKLKVAPDSKPEFIQETLFLNVLLEGEASLYQYVGEEIKVFFFKVEGTPITQLISRNYINEDNREVIDQTYIRQLFSVIRCEGIRNSVFEALDYTRNSLETFLQKYNACKGEEGYVYTNKNAKSPYHVAIKPGISLNVINIPTTETQAHLNTKFGSAVSFRLGMEFEYLLPRMGSRWSILFEPSFQQFTTDTAYSSVQYSVLIYKTIETGLGIKYYFNNRRATRFFASSRLLASFPLGDSRIDFGRSRDIAVGKAFHVNASLGILIQNRLSIEGTYWIKRSLSLLSNSFNSYSLIFGYRLF